LRLIGRCHGAEVFCFEGEAELLAGDRRIVVTAAATLACLAFRHLD
jgi:hypothetical protein